MPDTGLDKGEDMKAETFLPDDYRPAEDEPFMNERQLEYFRRKLIEWRDDLLEESRDTIEALQDGTRAIPMSPIAQAKRPTARWSFGHGTVSASWSPRSTAHCVGSIMANTAIAK